jgi:hypothetical protein
VPRPARAEPATSIDQHSKESPVGYPRRIHPAKAATPAHLYTTDDPPKSKVRGIVGVALTGALIAAAVVAAWLSLAYIYVGLLPL